MRKILTFLIIIALLGGGFYYFRQYRLEQQRQQTLANLQTETAQVGSLTAMVGATGVVRSNQNATLTWQTTGTVEAVKFQVGDRVSEGEVLATLKMDSLPQNIILAQAELVSARKALDDLLNSELQRAQALQAVEDAQQALEDALDPTLAQAQALQAIADAQKAVEEAERRLRILQSSASQADIDAAKAQVVLARDALDKAKDRYAPYENKPEDNLVRANLQSKVAAAQQAYDAAVRQLNALQATGNPTDIAVAEAELATAQAQLHQAQRDWERIKDGPTPAQIALLEAQLADARREWERLKDGPDPDDIAAAEARIAANEAILKLDRISAPFDGVLTEVLVKPGDQVSPGTLAFRLDDLSHLLVDVEVSEVDINRVQIGQEAILTFDAVLAKEYHGKVVEVGMVGSTVQGVVSFKVTVELLDADENVKPGMTAAVNIVVSQLEKVLLVPNRAVRLQDGKRVVYVLTHSDSAPVPVTVELGASSETYSQVIDGELKEGDKIVLNPPSDFSFFGPPGRGRR